MLLRIHFPVLKTLLVPLSIILGLILNQNVYAEDVNTTKVKQSVVEACTNYQNGKNVTADNSCKAYIDGFIDASLIADVATLGEQSSQAQRSELVQRAMKYRMGGWDIDGNQFNYEFCIPADMKPFNIKAKVAEHLDIDELAKVPLKREVMSTLKRLYPCSA